ncbi:MAG: EF-Tu/IF-2/RF-3 family GTPase [bacterium]
MDQKPLGKVEHYYPKAHAAVVRVEHGSLCVGDQIHIAGAGDDFWEEVTSLEMDHKPVQKAHTGEAVGLLVEHRVHEGAEVFKLDALEG